MFMLLWTQVAAALLVIFPLMGFVVAVPAKAKAGTPTLRVLSYNVDDAQISGSYDDVVAEIDRYSPDIACLVDAGDMIAPQLRARYPSVVVLNQFVVASRFTITSTTEPPSTFVEGRMHSPRFVRVALESPIGRLVTYCVHPISPREALYTARGIRGGILAGRAAAAFVKNSGLRERQVELFSEGALGEGDDPVIIAGDSSLPVRASSSGTTCRPFRTASSKRDGGLDSPSPRTRNCRLGCGSIEFLQALLYASYVSRSVRLVPPTTVASSQTCSAASPASPDSQAETPVSAQRGKAVGMRHPYRVEIPAAERCVRLIVKVARRLAGRVHVRAARALARIVERV